MCPAERTHLLAHTFEAAASIWLADCDQQAEISERLTIGEQKLLMKTIIISSIAASQPTRDYQRLPETT